MIAFKPRRDDDWLLVEDLDLDGNSTGYSELDHAAIEALTVHLGDEHYFDGYVE